MADDDATQVFEHDLADTDEAVAFVEFFLGIPGKILKLEIIKNGNVYTGELTVPAPAVPAPPPVNPAPSR
jgi:hypothetical protein